MGKWVKKDYGYRAKRGSRLLVYVIIEDIKPKTLSGVNNYIGSYCIIDNNQVEISYSLLNNSDDIALNKDQEELIKCYACEIYKKYYN